MTIEQIIYFLTIVETGTMNQGAKKLFVSQPNMSAAIKSLENELGFKLFDRGKKGLVLTARGRELIPYAEKLWQNYNSIKEIKDSLPVTEHTLTISLQYSFVAIPLFAKVLSNHMDGVGDFCIKQSSFYDVIRHVKEDIANFGLVMVNEYNIKVMKHIFQNNNLEFLPLTNVIPCLSVSEHHPLYEKEAAIEELFPYPLVFCDFAEKSNVYEATINGEILSHFKNKIRVHDLLSQYRVMESISAVGFNVNYKEIDFFSEMERYNIRMKLIEFEEFPRTILGCLKKKNVERTEVEKAFIKELNDFFSQTDCADLNV